MKLLITIFTVFIILSQAVVSQAEIVSEYLKLVAKGNTSQVKMQLPDLLAEYPNDPGVLLLHGVVIEDVFRAVKIYERVVKNYPQSQWADDSYWRIVIFYAIRGNISRAEKELNDFRTKYPASEFIVPATDVVRTAIGIARKQNFGVAPDSEMDMSDYEEPAKKAITTYEPPVAKRSAKPVEIKEETVIETPVAKIETNVPIPAKANQQKTETVKPFTTDANQQKAETVKPFTTDANQQKTEAFKPLTAKTYGLQVGIFTNKDYADNEMRKFLKQRMRTEVKQKVINGENMYAVVIGNYSSMESAEAAKLIVQQQCDCNPIVFQK